jgi:oleandomycin transport system ATP-binding protein
VPVREVRGMVPHAVRRLDDLGIEVDDVGVRHSTLDDVFFALTGHALDPDDATADVAVAS